MGKQSKIHPTILICRRVIITSLGLLKEELGSHRFDDIDGVRNDYRCDLIHSLVTELKKTSDLMGKTREQTRRLYKKNKVY